MPSEAERDPARRRSTDRSGTLVVAGIVGLAAVVALYFALGMPGMDHEQSDSMASMEASSGRYRRLDADRFAEIVDEPGVVTINVHVPDEGDIAGTDLRLPYNTLDASALPVDRATRLAVYCRTGRMSAIAIETLLVLGYTEIVELDGGMLAWEGSGRPLV